MASAWTPLSEEGAFVEGGCLGFRYFPSFFADITYRKCGVLRYSV